jgi:hypothetical protein
MWHYESDRPMSVAQLIAAGSLDARTAALLWLLVERHYSLIVSGPTDPTAGAGKTTTLNALLGFLPAGTTLVYTMGMYEDFAFESEVTPATTCVLANEVSDHLRIYMWGRVARKLLAMPGDGYAIATSCHADTVQDVLTMLTRDLRIDSDDIRRLGVIVNIGFVGRGWPPRRRFFTVNFVRPAADPAHPTRLELLPLSTWDELGDTFIPASDDALTELATLLGQTPDELRAALDRRVAILERLSTGKGVGVAAFRQAVDTLHAEEHGLPIPSGASSVTPHASIGDEDDGDDDEDDEDDNK